MRYRLRTLLLVITALVVSLGWHAEQMHRQGAAKAVIERAGGRVRYDEAGAWPLAKRLSRWLGEDAVQNVAAVYCGGASMGDDELTCLRHLPRLREVVLASSQVSDAGLRHLYALHELDTIDLRFTAVTQAGVADLRQALPKTKILSKSDID